MALNSLIKESLGGTLVMGEDRRVMGVLEHERIVVSLIEPAPPEGREPMLM